MDFRTELKDLAGEVTTEVVKALRAELDRSQKISPLIAEAVEEIIPQAEGGKRIRGALMIKGYELCGGTDRKEIMKAAVFIELIQIYLLIHDDFMDDDNLRRGVPTMHTRYEQIHKQRYQRRDARHFGQSIAICAGDVISHLAHEILLSAGFPADRHVKALQIMERQLQLVGYGQMLDVFTEVREDVTEEEILQLHRLKTGVYTYETPLLVSATLAGANDDQKRVLSEFAVPTGITFQIQDDMLGIYGTEDKLGKPVGSDLKEGKYTLLMHKAFEMGNPAQIKRLKELNGKSDITFSEVEEARVLIKETGSYQYSVDLAHKYIKQSQQILSSYDGFPGKQAQEFLQGMAQYMLDREY
mgnify:FL=1